MTFVANDPSRQSPVLAAVDFSTHSRRSLIYAARLAKILERPLVVLHVFHEDAGSGDGYGNPGAGGVALPLEVVAKTLLDDFVEKLGAIHPELGALDGARTGVVSGIPASRIAEMAELCNASMVVVGSRGLRGVAASWQGSVSQTVARNCRCSVVVARDHLAPDNRMAAASIGRSIVPIHRPQERAESLGQAVAA